MATQQEQIDDLTKRVTALEAAAVPVEPVPGFNQKGMDFSFEQPGAWLDVEIEAGTSQSRNFVPPAGWKGNMEVYAGRLMGNLTDRIKGRVLGAGNKVLFEDADWMNLDGYKLSGPGNGPAVVEITSELYGHISLGVQHQP